MARREYAEWTCDRCLKAKGGAKDVLPTDWKQVCLFGEPVERYLYASWHKQHLCGECAASLAEWVGGNFIARMKEQVSGDYSS